MKIAQAGLDLITSFEGYHRALPNGDCIAYRCPAGVWTLGFGCTAGIKEGMIWTRQQAQDAFRKELAVFEAAVNRLVTVEITQNMFDALVSLAYNIGAGGLKQSSVLRFTNEGKFAEAARGFALWNKARNGGPDKPLVVMAGLVRRRAAEAALYLTPDAPSFDPVMPQAVAPPPANPKGSRITATATTGETVAVVSGIGGIGLSFADALGYGGQILPMVKSYGLEAFILVMLCLGAGFAIVKHFRRQDHETGKTVQQ